jgi:hypothetical protein
MYVYVCNGRNRKESIVLHAMMSIPLATKAVPRYAQASLLGLLGSLRPQLHQPKD